MDRTRKYSLFVIELIFSRSVKHNYPSMQVKTKLYMCLCRTARTFSTVRNEHSEPDMKLSTSSLGFYFEECCIGWGRGFSRENRSACMPFWFGSIAATARLMKGGVAYSPISSQLPPSAYCSQFSATSEMSV